MSIFRRVLRRIRYLVGIWLLWELWVGWIDGWFFFRCIEFELWVVYGGVICLVGCFFFGFCR